MSVLFYSMFYAGIDRFFGTSSSVNGAQMSLHMLATCPISVTIRCMQGTLKLMTGIFLDWLPCPIRSAVCYRCTDMW
jgi:hypothetical protein